MLYRLEIENFYSIRERQIIDLRASASAPNDLMRLTPLWDGSDERAPKVIAIFGPNAAGKTTVLRALSFVGWFVKNSFEVALDAGLPYQRFSDIESLTRPSRLAVHFTGPVDIAAASDPTAPQCRYAYEISLGGTRALPNPILHEALHYWPSEEGRKVRLFERDSAGRVATARAFGLKELGKILATVLRPNASVISTLAHLRHAYASLLWEAAASIGSNVLMADYSLDENQLARYYANNPEVTKALNQEIQRIDLGINEMIFSQGQNGPRVDFAHKGLAGTVPYVLESAGTRRFVNAFPLIHKALETGGIAALDELDNAIHPKMLPEVLRWFQDPDRNPKSAQLWLTCHSVSLLEDLTKEEVLFCEKDQQGRTSVYGLNDIQGVRRDENYFRKYMGGVYGALPLIG